MGMSSSQARLLNLTSRMHQIEYKAAKLEAEKLQMANKSTRVYENYLNALDATKIQYSTLGTDGSINYVDATYNNLVAAGYQLLFADEIDTVVVDQETYDNYVQADGNLDYFIALESGRGTVNDDGTITVTEVNADGSTTEWIEIYTADQLSSMKGQSGNYRLMSDIDLSGYDWTSISTFKGTFDGNGHTISGLTSALFSSLSGATVSNLYINGDITLTSGKTTTGILANTISNSTISDIAISGSITGTDSSIVTASAMNVGALAGYISNSTISTVTSSATIDVTYNGSYSSLRIGGLSGCTHDSTISDCSVTGDITVDGGGGTFSSSSNIGGISACGQGSSYVNCTYSGTIDADLSSTLNSYDVVGSNGSSITTSDETQTQTIETTETLDDTISSDYSVVGATTASAVYAAIAGGNFKLDTDPGYRSMLEGYEDSTKWLTNMVNQGYLYIYAANSDGDLEQVSVSTDTGLREVSDETALKKAEAQYEADMKKIDLKDTKYDTDLAALETEREALKNEIDTLKTVASDNVERTFKLFS